MKKTLITCAIVIATLLCVSTSYAKSPKVKFYDFQDQLIDGELKRPTSLFIDRRKNAKFERLISLKKSFMKDLLLTAKHRAFK